MQWKIEKRAWVSKIVSFELIAVSSRYYRKILFIGLKIRDITKKDFLQLLFSQNDEQMW